MAAKLNTDALAEAESYARMDGGNAPKSLSPEKAAASDTISEKGGDGMYFKMEEDALVAQQTVSISQDKPCAKKEGKNQGTRFKWFKWGDRQSRGKQLDDLTPGLTDDVKDDASCTSSLGSLWAKDDLINEKKRKGKKASKASRMQLDLSSKCKTSFDDNEGYMREEGPSFEESLSGQNQREDILDGKTRNRQIVLLFLLQLGGVFLLSVLGSASGYGDIAYMIIECSMFASAVSVGIFSLMVRFPGKWLRSSLTVSLSIFLGVLVVAFLREESAPCIILLAIFVLSLIYCAYSWKRLPSVASSFYTSVSVIESNTALYTAAFLLQLAAVAWCILWVLACTFVLKETGPWFVLLFLISYLWVEEIFKNIMHVSAARLVGKWWLSPGEGHPGGFKRILRKSCTSLFGSICYGSLFVNYFLGLRKLPKSEIYERKIAEYPLVKYVHDASIYMNKWGFVYVGLYELPFFQAGKNVATLFQERGWSQLIADDLTDNILLIIKLAVATSTGAFAWILSSGNNHYNMVSGLSYYHPYTAGFFVGFFAGFLVSSIMIAVFGGVVNAIIVCFAERPSALEESHPDQFKMLLQDWPLDLPEGIKMPKTKKRFMKKSEDEEPMAYMIEKHEQVNDIIINILGEPDDEKN